MTVLVDSDILIEVSRAKDDEILRRWSELSDSDSAVLCSVVSIAELQHGALPREHDILTNLFRAVTCVAIDQETARMAGDFLRLFRKTHGLELGDALVAASAAMNRAVLWTRNRKNYPMKAISFF